MPIDLGQFADLLQKLSIIGVLGLMLFLFLREVIVPKGRLDDQKALTSEALGLLRDQTAATNRLADAWEARNEAEERVRK